MTTRREFLTGCASLATVAASGKPIRSSLGADNVVKSAAGWSNPYVTDGLIAMWDGEFPSGVGGKIEQDATEWVDLVNGSVYGRGTGIFYNATGKYFDTNKIGASDAARFYYPTTSMNAITFEVVVRCDYASGNWRNLFGATNGGSFVQIGVDSGRLNPQGSSREYFFSKGEWHYAAYVIKSGSSNAFMYLDGELVLNGGIPVSDVSFAACPNNSAGNVSGCLSSVRVYNRALAGNELKANYAVDKERFNLP